MKHYLVASAVALALAIPVSAQAQSDAEISELKSQVEALNNKLAEVEAKQAKAGWTEKIAMKGDFRYRFEGIDEEDKENQDRQRIRARFFLTGDINDRTQVTMELSTGGSNPRSRDTTLDGDASAKDITLRQAYARWRATDQVSVTAGKMSQAWALNPVDYFFDSDYMFEGLAVNFGGGSAFFGSLQWYQIDERSADDDTSVWSGQVGYAGEMFYANLGYQDFIDVQGFNPCYNGNCNGNTVDGSGNLVYDYNVLQLRGGVKLAGFDLFASWAQNGDADDEDTAYSYGVSYGKVKDPGSWSVAALYQDVEKDALYGGMIDATFAGGRTAHDGFSVKGAYGLSKNWQVSFIYFINSIDKTGTERDYDRYQLDLLWKF